MNILFQIRTVIYSIREGLELVTRKLAKTPFLSYNIYKEKHLCVCVN